MNMTLPDLIGYPGKQTNSEFSEAYNKFVDDRIVIGTLIPGKPLIKNDANVFEFQNDWVNYEKDLKELDIAPPKKGKKQLDIVISQLSPISRTYSNNYGDSKIFPSGDMIGQNIQDIIQLTGGNTEELEKLLKDENGGMIRTLLGKGVGGWNKLANFVKNAGSDVGDKIGGGGGKFLKNVTSAVSDLAKSPQSKIGWPKMWRDCSFLQTFQLNTRLYCYSTDNKDDYNNNIKACIGALELFVTPKAKEGVLYTAPYIIQFEIPGMIYFPQAYVSEMTVIEGGNEGDFAQTGKPNVVDITMTIQNLYSICVNTTKKGEDKYPMRPTIHKDLKGLSSGRNTEVVSIYNGGSGTDGKDVRWNNVQEEWKKDIVDDEAAKRSTGRKQLTDAQRKSHKGLNDKGNKSNENNQSESESENPSESS